MTRSRAFFLAAVSIAALTAGAAQAQTVPTAAGDVDAVVVTGTRGQPRTVANSPVPIDVVSGAELRQVSSNDTLDILKAIVPSYSVSRNINSNTGTFIRPVSIRGLSEDKTLLLMNGKRRHKTASVATAGSGAQGSDAAVIPSIAIKSVEVLRDGAAAQYGSDAIAGVVNFTLKDNREGIELSAQTGQYYEGDGTSYQLAGNIGLPLLDRGFVNISAQFNMDGRTDRSTQFRTNTFGTSVFDATVYAASNPAYAAFFGFPDNVRHIQRQGAPDSSSARAIVNAGYEFDNGSQLYAFANLSSSRAQTDGNYRYPTANQPVMDTPVRLQDGSIFRWNQIFPYGLSPQFAGYVHDKSIAGGWKGEKTGLLGGDLAYDISGRYGRNQIIYKVFGTVNAAVGPTGASQMNFRPIDFRSEEKSFNTDFTWSRDVGFHTPLALSFGTELRKETYTIKPGDAGSIKVGTYATVDPYDFCTGGNSFAAGQTLRPTAPQNMGINCALSTDPVYRTLPVGPNVFSGTPQSAAGDFSVDSKSAYVEAATEVTEKLFVDLAARYEDFSTFGSTSNYKAAARYAVTDWLGVRASIGTGFHAPSPGLLNTTSVSISSVDGVSVLAGTFPSSNPVSVFLGAKPLKPEESKNYSLGLTLHPFSGFDLTVDGYQIKITDQIYSTSNIAVTPAIAAAMTAAGVAGASSIANVRFFQNAFDSTTKGLDVVATYKLNWENGQRTSLTGAFNMNTFKIDNLKIAGLFNAQSTFNFEHNAPRWRGILTLQHTWNNFQFTLRDNVFGHYKFMSTVAPFPVQTYKAGDQQIDMDVKYTFLEKYSITVGGRNVFDKYPDKDKLFLVTNGTQYRDGPVDIQGGYYFARFDAKF
jgi:iron complex outermembrane receptor protein